MVFGVGKAKFNGFVPADFDAYQEKKWGSNRFNLERMRTREKLTGLHISLQSAWKSHGETLEVGWSHDHPTVFNHKKVSSQWCYTIRSEDARKMLTGTLSRSKSIGAQVEDPALHHLHALVALEIDSEGLGCFFGLHRNASVDTQNLVSKLQDEREFESFKERIVALPEKTILRKDDQESPLSEAKEWTAAEWISWIGSSKENAPQSWLRIGTWQSRDTDTLASEEGSEFLGTWMATLTPLLHFMQWSQDNDFLDLAESLREEKSAREIAQLAAQNARTKASEEREKSAKEGREKEKIERVEREKYAEARRKREREKLAARAAEARANPKPSGPAPDKRTPQPPRRSDGPAPQPRKERSPQPPRRSDGPAPQPRKERTPQPPRRSDGPAPQPRKEMRGARGPDSKSRPQETPRNDRSPRTDRRDSDRSRKDSRSQDSKRDPRRDSRNQSRGPRSGGTKSFKSQGRAQKETIQRVRAEGPIVLGAFVELKSGLLAGRHGQVLELSAKGDAKILVGQFPTRLHTQELILLKEDK